ncbi:MAG: hypothetical protein LLG45_10325 [Actinomycetia bacterium]|nr:hypothetical protein [Actinomycetes bacterium]
MSVSEFERFAVRRPFREAGRPGAAGRRASPLVFLSNGQVPEANAYVDLTWVYGIPEPNPNPPRQVLDHDQFLIYIGMDHRRPQVLGGTVELELGGQPIVLNTTTAVYVPRGTLYGQAVWKELHHPLLQVTIVPGSGGPHVRPGREAVGAVGDGAPSPTGEFDYEQYVVRSPLREAGPDYVEGRQNPTMTYMSGKQVPGVKNYLEIGWIWDVPTRPIPRMRHANHDEIVLHIGGDSERPEDLGATMRFDLGDDLLEFDTTHCVFIPRELVHGPLIWKEVRRPMIELAVMLGAGTWAEGWEGSFFDES